MSQIALPEPSPRLDEAPGLFDANTVAGPAPGVVRRAADIQVPPRAAHKLPAPNDWTFELVEQYHAVFLTCNYGQRGLSVTHPIHGVGGVFQ